MKSAFSVRRQPVYPAIHLDSGNFCRFWFALHANIIGLDLVHLWLISKTICVLLLLVSFLSCGTILSPEWLCGSFDYFLFPLSYPADNQLINNNALRRFLSLNLPGYCYGDFIFVYLLHELCFQFFGCM